MADLVDDIPDSASVSTQLLAESSLADNEQGLITERIDAIERLLVSRELEAKAQARDARKRIWKRFWSSLMDREPFCIERSLTNASDDEHRILGDDNTTAQTGVASTDAYLVAAHKLPWATTVTPLMDSPFSLTPPELYSFDGKVQTRFLENCAIAEHVSLESYKQELKDMSERNDRIENLKHMVLKLVGVDVYWNGKVEAPAVTRDKQLVRVRRKNTSIGRWGSLRVIMFPFTAIFRYEDDEGFVIFSLAPVVGGVRRSRDEAMREMRRLVELNNSDSVKALRQRRQRLRYLDGSLIQVSVGKDESTRTAARGVLEFDHSIGIEHDCDTWTNNAGQTLSLAPHFHWTVFAKDEERQTNSCAKLICAEPESAVSLDCYVQRDDDDMHEGAVREFTMEAMGIRNPMDISDRGVLAIIEGNPADPAMKNTFDSLYEEYRHSLMDEFAYKNKVLPYSFHVEVYENDLLTLDELKDTLVRIGARHVNDQLYASDVSASAAQLYATLKTFDARADMRFWIMWWFAVVDLNASVGYEYMPHSVARLFDPAEATAATRRLLPRAELEQTLKSLDLDGLFSPSLIDKLYAKMADVRRREERERRRAKDKRRSSSRHRRSRSGRHRYRSGNSSRALSTVSDTSYIDSINESELAAGLTSYRVRRRTCADLCGEGRKQSGEADGGVCIVM